MKRGNQVRVGLGIPSMVLILLVLCLVMLGVLSLISARADWAISRRYAELTEESYRASDLAQQTLAALDAQMAHLMLEAESDGDYAAACQAIEEVGGIPVEWDGDVATLTFDAQENRVLCVQIERNSLENAGVHRYLTINHKLNDVGEWMQTESLLLMGV